MVGKRFVVSILWAACLWCPAGAMEPEGTKSGEAALREEVTPHDKATEQIFGLMVAASDRELPQRSSASMTQCCGLLCRFFTVCRCCVGDNSACKRCCTHCAEADDY